MSDIRKLEDGEYLCLFGKKTSNQPCLVHEPGPWFVDNAIRNGDRIAIVRLVDVETVVDFKRRRTTCRSAKEATGARDA